jgi:hypothetical protein
MFRCTLFGTLTLAISVAHAQMPDAIATPGQVDIARFHAEGAQVYECKVDAAGNLGWQYREPIASLLADGQTVGRHYVGPSWELNDGSLVVARVAGHAPGATSADIPWLKLDVTYGNGRLDRVSAIQRINTKGGNAPATCATVGSFLSVPYSAEYVFLRRQ